MQRYIIRRLLQGIPILLIVSVIIFGLMRSIPGDAVDMALGVGPEVTEEMREALRREWGLDRPAHVQYWNWFTRLLRGDLGHSLYSRYPVNKLFAQKFPATLQLAVVSLLIALLIAIPTAILAAIYPNSLIDYLVSISVTLGMAMPGFWLGIVLMIVFAISLKWLPCSGYVPISEDLQQNVRHMILPATTVAILLAAPIMRFLRASMLEAIQEDYVRTARAKGLTERVVVLGHALKNALIPTITVVGMQFAGLLGGTVAIEWVFAWPGIGWLAMQGIRQRDYAVVQATVLLVAAAFVFINIAVDVIYVVIDPRIRYD